MRIKSLEIFGFKSFADRAIIHFTSPITGIVGPNGCGKSNVVDALRFVMGEQSSKSLRGGSMHDVIFNGSSSRKGLGFAEVTLTLENDGEEGAGEYAPYSEIQVTRRLYKTGDAEYEINRQTCRLRDITELFLGTGVGAKAYSVIEQGQIAALVSAKPDERRIIIEEAAGITKYESKKRAAEKKIESTRQNLARIADVHREVGIRLALLEKQAKKTERAKRLKQELKEAELQQFALQFLENLALLKTEEATKQQLEEAFNSLEHNLKACEAQYEVEKAQREDVAQKNQLYISLQREAEQSIALNKNEIHFIEASVENNKSHIHRLSEESHTLLKQKSENELAEAHQREQLKQFQQELMLAEENFDKLSATLSTAKTQAHESSRVMQDLQQQLQKESQAASHAQNNIQSFALKKERFETKQNLIDGELKNLDARKIQIVQALETFKNDLATLNNKKQQIVSDQHSAKNKLHTVKNDLDSSQKKLSQLDRDIVQHKSRCNSLQEIIESRADSSSAVSFLADKKHNNRIKIFSDLIEVAEEYEHLVECALSHKLESIIVDSAARAQELIEKLSGAKSGRATFYVLPSLSSKSKKEIAVKGSWRLVDKINAADDVKNILNPIVVVPTIEDAFNNHHMALENGIELLTLSGIYFALDGSITGGVQNKSSAMLARKKELKVLSEQIERLEAQRAEHDSQHQTLIAEQRACYQSLDEAKKVEQELALKLARLEEIIKNNQRECNDIAAKQAVHLKENAENVQFLQQFSQEYEALRITWEQALKNAGVVEEALSKQKVIHTELELVLNKSLESSMTSQVALVTVKERCNTIQNSLKQIAIAKDDIAKKLTENETLMHKMSEEQAVFNDKKKVLLVKVDESTKECEAIIQSLQQISTLLTQHTQLVAQCEAQLIQLRQNAEAKRGQLFDVRMKVQQFELQIKGIKERLSNTYRLGMHDVLVDFHDKALPAKDLDSEIRHIRKSIELLGAVNETAIEEFNELQQRNVFLESQCKDLSQALEELEHAIAKINYATAQRFSEAFEAINEQFSKVFPKLFRGGRAWLELTNKNDLLKSGIEIFAEPPGKKLSSMALMSGGEKALTAASLVFAIFLIKPSPFCLLDEVDAPLDEANVQRFGQMIKEMSKLSQFIIISHNKKTMEIMDHLYGVTMEEAGVSKLVDVRMSDYEASNTTSVASSFLQ